MPSLGFLFKCFAIALVIYLSNFAFMVMADQSQTTSLRLWGRLVVADRDSSQNAAGARIHVIPDDQNLVLDQDTFVDADNRWQVFSDPIPSPNRPIGLKIEASHSEFPDYVILEGEARHSIDPEATREGDQLVSSFTVYLRSRGNASSHLQAICDKLEAENEACYRRALDYSKRYQLFESIATIQLSSGRFEDCALTYNDALNWLLERYSIEAPVWSKVQLQEFEESRDSAGRQYITCLYQQVRSENAKGENIQRSQDWWYVAEEAARIMRYGIRPDAQNRHRSNVFRSWIDSLKFFVSAGPAHTQDLAEAIVSIPEVRESFEDLYFTYLTGCQKVNVTNTADLILMIDGVERTLRGRGRQVCARADL